AMKNVHFQFKGGTYSYGGFYSGFGFYITVYLLFLAFFAFHLGGLAKMQPEAVGGLGWVFFSVQAGWLVFSWIYFFPVPTIFSALVAIGLGWAAWLVPAAKF